MGLQCALTKEQNHMGIDFPGAYFAIDNFGFGESSGEYIVNITLNGYPNRETKHMSGKSVSNSSLPFGGAYRMIYEPCIYSWNTQFKVDRVFPEGIPTDIDEVKTKLYKFIKSYLNDVEFVDIFEEGQS